MRCLFCKKPSDDSRSKEHIIPESIGNTRHVLPRGVVCDRCNNYFARKVEGPLLSHSSFRNLRAWYGIPNKRGISPSLSGFVAGTDIDIGLRVSPAGDIDIQPERERDRTYLEERFRLEAEGIEPNVFAFPLGVEPPKKEMSRFLAKMALESLALRFLPEIALLDRLIDDLHFDRIRNYARYGDNYPEWPFHQRRIFPEETLMRHPVTGAWVQAGFGFDLFVTKRHETYFAFALYGLEFVINVGGPSAKGYEEWLEDHHGASPLVERIGLRRSVGVGGDAGKFYLIGTSNRFKSCQFDRAEFHTS